MDAHFITWGPVVEGQPGHFIGCDNLTGAYLMTKHLIDLGYKKIASLGGVSEQAPEFQARYQGYVKSLLEAKLIVNPNLQIDAETSEDSGYEAANALLSTKYCFDDIPIAAYCDPPLTTVKQDTILAGELLVDNLKIKYLSVRIGWSQPGIHPKPFTL